jgi:hypothetical protein
MCGKTIQKFYLKYHLQTKDLKDIKEIESSNSKDLIKFE